MSGDKVRGRARAEKEEGAGNQHPGKHVRLAQEGGRAGTETYRTEAERGEQGSGVSKQSFEKEGRGGRESRGTAQRPWT